MADSQFSNEVFVVLPFLARLSRYYCVHYQANPVRMIFLVLPDVLFSKISPKTSVFSKMGVASTMLFFD